MSESERFAAHLATRLMWCPLRLASGRLYKVCGGACMYAPAFIVSDQKRWPS